MQIFAESIGDDDAFQGEIEASMGVLRGKPYALLFGLADQLFGAQRCNEDLATPCPEGTTSVCDEELLSARVAGAAMADPGQTGTLRGLEDLPMERRQRRCI